MPKAKAKPRTKVGRGRKQNLQGKGFMDFVRGVGNFVKDNKIISRGLSLIPHPNAQIGSKVAGLFGFGKHPKGKKPRVIRGGNMALAGVRTNHIML